MQRSPVSLVDAICSRDSPPISVQFMLQFTLCTHTINSKLQIKTIICVRFGCVELKIIIGFSEKMASVARTFFPSNDLIFSLVGLFETSINNDFISFDVILLMPLPTTATFQMSRFWWLFQWVLSASRRRKHRNSMEKRKSNGEQTLLRLKILSGFFHTHNDGPSKWREKKKTILRLHVRIQIRRTTTCDVSVSVCRMVGSHIASSFASQFHSGQIVFKVFNLSQNLFSILNLLEIRFWWIKWKVVLWRHSDMAKRMNLGIVEQINEIEEIKRFERGLRDRYCEIESGVKIGEFDKRLLQQLRDRLLCICTDEATTVMLLYIADKQPF